MQIQGEADSFTRQSQNDQIDSRTQKVMNQNQSLDSSHERAPAGMYDIEAAFEEMGGFGKFQWIATVALVLARNGGNFMYYGFAYLTMEQMYQCRSSPNLPYSTCSAENDICPSLDSDSPLDYRVDTSYEYYLNNWYVQMDLVCVNKLRTNSMISA